MQRKKMIHNIRALKGGLDAWKSTAIRSSRCRPISMRHGISCGRITVRSKANIRCARRCRNKSERGSRAHSNSTTGFTPRDFTKIGWRESAYPPYNPACILRAPDRAPSTRVRSRRKRLIPSPSVSRTAASNGRAGVFRERPDPFSGLFRNIRIIRGDSHRVDAISVSFLIQKTPAEIISFSACRDRHERSRIDIDNDGGSFTAARRRT